MKLAIGNTRATQLFGEQKSFELIRQAGFDAVDLDTMRVDLGENYLAAAHETRRLLDAAGLVCNQAHAPFFHAALEMSGVRYGMKMDVSEPAFLRLTRSFEYAAIAGARHIVVHGLEVPMGGRSRASLEYNYAFFKALEPYAEKAGICIALENLGEALSDSFYMSELLRMLDSPRFVALLDTGHARLLFVRPQSFLRDMPRGTVKGLHLHDNHGVKDEHLLPGMGVIRWDSFLKALAEIGYDGDFTLEVGGFCNFFDEEDLPAALNLAAAVGRKYMKRLEQYQNA